jgi:hypothetical protein
MLGGNSPNNAWMVRRSTDLSSLTLNFKSTAAIKVEGSTCSGETAMPTTDRPAARSVATSSLPTDGL